MPWMLGCTKYGLLSASGKEAGYYDRLEDKYCSYLRQERALTLILHGLVEKSPPFSHCSFLYNKANTKNIAETKTIKPPVATSTNEDSRIPSTVLTTLKPTDAINVLLKDILSCKAESPGSTKRATTRIIPITLIEMTIVAAANKSKMKDNLVVGTPITRESSSSKTIDKSSLLKSNKKAKMKKPIEDTLNKSVWSIVKIEPKRKLNNSTLKARYNKIG